MSQHLCPACWRVHAEGALAARCPACESGRRRSAVKRPSLRTVEQLSGSRLLAKIGLDDGVGGWPRCRTHRDRELELFCQCESESGARTQLRATSQLEGELSLIGMAGARAVGKTILIVTMVEALRQSNGGAVEVGLTGIGQTEHHFDPMRRAVFDEGRKPDATRPAAAGGPEHHFAWQLIFQAGKRRPRKAGVLGFHDVGGETWESLGRERLPDDFARYLGAVTGMIFVVNGAEIARRLGLHVSDAWEPGDARSDFADTMLRLGGVVDGLAGRAGELDLAIVVSKADHLWEHEPKLREIADDPSAEAERHERIEGLLELSGWSDLTLQARAHFREVALFAASSLGFCPTPQDLEGERLSRPVDPRGVALPALWLIRKQMPGLFGGRA